MGARLGEDRLEVILHRVLGHEHQPGDVAGGRPGDDVAEQFGLAGTQPAGPGEQRDPLGRRGGLGWATRQPGFVSGQWLLAPECDQGMGVVVFASEHDASAAEQGPRGYARDENRAWNIEDVTVYPAGHRL
jgi:hypothetical protein